MARQMTTMAEFERRMLSQRIRKQYEVYRAQGRHLRGRKPFGFTGGPDHKLAPHPEYWPLALRVIEQLGQRGSFNAVAARLPAWCPWTPSASNLRNWFCNPVIRGHIGHGWNKKPGWKGAWREMHYDQHPALISESDWQDLATYLQRPVNRFNPGSREAKHALSGMLKCAKLSPPAAAQHQQWCAVVVMPASTLHQACAGA